MTKEEAYAHIVGAAVDANQDILESNGSARDIRIADILLIPSTPRMRQMSIQDNAMELWGLVNIWDLRRDSLLWHLKNKPGVLLAIMDILR